MDCFKLMINFTISFVKNKNESAICFPFNENLEKFLESALKRKVMQQREEFKGISKLFDRPKREKAA